MSRKAFRRSVTTTSTAVKDLGEIGDKRFEDGKTYRLVYTAATQAAGAVLCLDSTDAALASYTVQVTPASTSVVFGVNATGATLATGTYFWAQVDGPWAAESGVFGTLATLAVESPLVLNSDLDLSSVLATNTIPFGSTINTVSSLTSDQDAAASYLVFLKASGS